MSRRVLMVAYNFPPIGGVGMLRSLKYATYLPESGWEPVVLTARDPSGFRDEEALAALPPTLRVERAFSPEPAKVRRVLGRTARAVLGAARAARSGGPAARALATGASAPGASLPGAMASPATAAQADPGWQKQAASLWAAAVKATCYPDDEVGWVPFAIARGLEVNGREPIDVVYSSSPPVSCHLAAAVIARRTGLPWVADFRDPWIGNAFAGEPSGIHSFLRRKIERRIVDSATRVVFASDGLTEAYADRYPWARDRFLTIPNGYDRADLLGAATPPPTGAADGRFHLVYGGSLYGDRELELFLEGVELLVARRPRVRDELAVEFVGWLNLHNQAVAARFDTADRLGGMLTFAGFVPHREAVGRLARADALLQIIADDPNKGRIQGGKLMEYVGLDRQILAVVPPGRARELLAELDWGIVADPTPAAVADGLERLLVTPAPGRRADPDGRYDRANLTKRFAWLLDEVAGGSELRG